MPPTDRYEVSEAELSALADGTIADPDRRAELERRIDASPELSALYDRERRVVMMLNEARAERAPHALRMRIEAQRPAPARRLRLRIGYGVGLAGALAAALLVIALALPSGSGGPSVSQAAALALKGPQAPAPAPDPRQPSTRLSLAVRSVYFPNWLSSLGWRAMGERIDSFFGRPAVTVYYTWKHQVVAYTIVDLPALRQPTAPITQTAGVEYRTLQLRGRIVVTWRRDRQTCVLSGAGVSANQLRTLAAWDSRGLHDVTPHASTDRYGAQSGSAA